MIFWCAQDVSRILESLSKLTDRTAFIDKVVKPTMDAKVISRILENSVNLGNPVIFEDAGETFDPMLEPLLGKQIEKKGAAMYIRIAFTA